jgi:hypothetical protein
MSNKGKHKELPYIFGLFDSTFFTCVRRIAMEKAAENMKKKMLIHKLS